MSFLTLWTVANKFGEVHSALYKSLGNRENIEELKGRIHGLIESQNSAVEVVKLTPEVLMAAATRMKPHKMDVSQGFTSDRLLHAPYLLFKLLGHVFQFPA